MNLHAELERWRGEERRLAEARRAAWDRDPGNTNTWHVFYNAHGYHSAFKAWAEARDRLRELEGVAAREARQ
jgi:hypothetical protein